MSQAVLQDGKIFLGKSVKPEYLDLSLANRHGLITGATGTGKTVTLQVLAEGFSRAGVPVFAADIKGDLSGIAEVGEPKDFLLKRAAEVGLENYKGAASPVVLWDVFGAGGHPIRATVEDMGPLLLSRMLELNDVQEGVLNIAFRVASEEKLPLINLGDLRAIINNVASRAKELTTKFGNVAITSVGAIQRRLLVLDEQGANHFFGEPALDIWDFIRTAPDGRGVVNILAAENLMEKPRLYATFLLWMLTKLWQTLPEVGDLPKPKLVFFFDEAHLLFDDAPKALMDKIEQVVRLIRSKGVGVFFITQNPLDIPDTVLGQLGNRVQHALRAYTPRDQKAVKAAAETFRPNPALDTAQVITELGVGEALVSFLDEKGRPNIVERAFILPPASQIGPISPAERQAAMAGSVVAGVYEKLVDRESAHEIITRRTAASAATEKEAQVKAETTASKQAEGESTFGSILGGLFGSGGSKRESAGQAMMKSAARSIGSQVGREIIRGVLGSILKRR